MWIFAVTLDGKKLIIKGLPWLLHLRTAVLGNAHDQHSDIFQPGNCVHPKILQQLAKHN
jgi:hypothetical protein